MASAEFASSTSRRQLRSRNLRSANLRREHELTRLNLIEQRRRRLESARQDELFARMSLTVAATAAAADDDLLASAKSGQEQPIAAGQVAATDDGDLAEGAESEPPPHDAVDSLEATQVTRAAPQVDLSVRATGAGFSEQIEQIDLDSAPESRSPPAAFDLRDKQVEFAACRVPKAKRVLCLIVRDKTISSRRLNRAKSYFCPTYYLFVQAIVDVDEPLGYSAFAASRVGRRDDLASDESPPSPASSQNSFSASSSISADMRFIEPVSATCDADALTKPPTSYSDNELSEPSAETGQRAREAAGSGGAAAAAKVASWRQLAGGEQSPPALEKISPEPVGERRQSQAVAAAAPTTLAANSRETSGWAAAAAADVSSWFDNERNPFTGASNVLLSGQRRKKAKTYLIGPGEFGYARKNSVCKLKSNVLGTQFNAVRLNRVAGNDRCTTASVSYETNVLGFKGPRRMKVLLARDPNEEPTGSMAELLKRSPSSIVQLKNMAPSWNAESQSYVLNFHGRVTQASVKNFQLIECCDDHNQLERCDEQQQHLAAKQFGNGGGSQSANGDGAAEHNNGAGGNGRAACNEFSEKAASNKSLAATSYNDSIVMQFGRISDHEFTCDVSHPLSILQAFSIALSSFDSKLACE